MADQAISVSINDGIRLQPRQLGSDSEPLLPGTIIQFTNNTDQRCEVGNFYPEGWIIPPSQVLEPRASKFYFVTIEVDSLTQMTYWCTPTAPQSTKALDEYNPAQGIIIVDPPGDDDDKHEKREREAMVGQ